jgi:hypothetical protein
MRVKRGKWDLLTFIGWENGGSIVILGKEDKNLIPLNDSRHEEWTITWL